MNDDQLRSLLEAGFEAMDTEPRDVERSVHQVMERKARVRQRSRWWPFPVSYRRAETPAATDITPNQPSPIPATDGQTPTVTGRTQTMFSPAKAITAGALVFAIGGVILVSQTVQQPSAVPGAEAEAVAPMWVTGTIASAPSCSSGDVEIDGDVRRWTNVECSPQTWTSSDPRLTGEVVRRWSEDNYTTDEGTISVSVDAAYLRNDDGDWACVDTSLLRGSGMSSEAVTDTTFTCNGNGDYAGLSAIVVSSIGPGFDEEFVGLIFSGDFPPVPEPPTAE